VVRGTAGHREHFAIDVLAGEFGFALDFEVLVRREVRDWLSGHGTVVYQCSAEWRWLTLRIADGLAGI
jgi:hypothetical protein